MEFVAVVLVSVASIMDFRADGPGACGEGCMWTKSPFLHVKIVMNHKPLLDILSRDDKDLDHLIDECLSSPDGAYRLAVRAAGALLENYQNQKIRHRAVWILVRLATNRDKSIATAGLHGLFPLIAERLSDAFDPSFSAIYDVVFAEVLCVCRSLPDGEQIHRALGRFGIRSFEDFMARKERLRNRAPFHCRYPEQYRKCFVLSRVTLGAEVAVTSVVIAKLLEIFPLAEVILIGDGKNAAIFHEIPRFRIRHCRYPAGGGLLDKIQGWIDALAAVDDEIAGLSEESYLIIDPDSRLTQLGLLPLLENENSYLFFESRSFQPAGVDKIGLLTNHWLKRQLGGGDKAPFIRLPFSVTDYARRFRCSFMGCGKKQLVGISFGVGGNNKKRLGIAFELELLKHLAAFRDTVILYFKGVGEPELKRSAMLLHALCASFDLRILNIAGNDPDDLIAAKDGIDIIAWEGPLSEYCALIAATDIQVGYDSSSQHIAAACGVPTIDIFADESTPMSPKRWTPHGPKPVRIVQAYESRISGQQPVLYPDISDDSFRLDRVDPKNRFRLEKGLKEAMAFFVEIKDSL